MWNLIKKYIDIFGGFIGALFISILARFKLYTIQLISSIIILILVCIGVCKLIKNSIETRQSDENNKKRKKKRKKIVVDKMVDSRQEMKAINIAQNPLQQGEELYNAMKKSRKEIKKIMNKLKKFFDRFKGYMLTILLFILTILSEYGGFIDNMFNGKLVVNDVNIISCVMLICTIIVGLLSNTYTKEQRKKIKEIFTKKPSNEIVNEELKNQLKIKESSRKSLEKQIENNNSTLDSYEKDLEQAQNVYNAKIEMQNMIPMLATDDDVRESLSKVNEIKDKIEKTKSIISGLEKDLNDVNNFITMLKNRLDQ